MAEEENEGEGKKKFPLVKVLLIVFGVLILLAVAVGGTLFATGFFDAKDAETAETKLEGMEKEAQAAQAAASGEPGAPGTPGAPPQRVSKESPALQRFEHTYLELERELLANLHESRKVMQVQLAMMTRYDERVFKNVKKHEFALRSVALDVMRQTTEADIASPTFRKDLAEKLRTELNAQLEKFEDFGGIEEIYFTTFVIQ